MHKVRIVNTTVIQFWFPYGTLLGVRWVRFYGTICIMFV